MSDYSPEILSPDDNQFTNEHQLLNRVDDIGDPQNWLCIEANLHER